MNTPAAVRSRTRAGPREARGGGTNKRSENPQNERAEGRCTLLGDEVLGAETRGRGEWREEEKEASPGERPFSLVHISST